ncbi:MAG TPA: AI-2E family transporter [Candidatus Ozemobacteraceae bacterium]|nr:AI-2E family transporter [Candidatus Ozemobacteraceae bacterium]
MFIRELPATAKNVLILLGGIVSLWLTWQLSDVIAPFLVSLVLAYILNPLIHAARYLYLPRPWAVLALFVLGLGLSVVILIPFVLNIVSEGHDLASRLQTVDVQQMTNQYRLQGQELYDRYSQIPWVREYLGVAWNNDRVRDLAAKAVVMAKDVVMGVIRKVFSWITAAFSGVMGLFLIPLLTFYMLLDLELLFAQGLLLVPPVYRVSTERILAEIDSLLSSYVRGQIVSCLIFGSLATLGLWLSGLPFAVLLGPMAGLANLIPYLGGLVTVILATLVALVQTGVSWAFVILMIKVAVTLSIVQAIDGFLVQPKIVGDSVGLHPLMVILALIVGGSLFGLLGMLLSVPVTCVFKVLSRELYHELYDAA